MRLLRAYVWVKRRMYIRWGIYTVRSGNYIEKSLVVYYSRNKRGLRKRFKFMLWQWMEHNG